MEDENTKSKEGLLDSSRLTDEQGERLVALLNEKISNLCCELCGSTDFTINPHLASPVFVTLNTEGVSELDWGFSHPCALAHCDNCGNTKFHSLRFLNFDPHAGDKK